MMVLWACSDQDPSGSRPGSYQTQLCVLGTRSRHRPQERQVHSAHLPLTEIPSRVHTLTERRGRPVPEQVKVEVSGAKAHHHGTVTTHRATVDPAKHESVIIAGARGVMVGDGNHQKKHPSIRREIAHAYRVEQVF